MVSAEAKVVATEAPSSPRISFSADFLHDVGDTDDFISISPLGSVDMDKDDTHKAQAADFEFLSVSDSNDDVTSHRMLSADELFFEGKLLPFWQTQQSSEKLSGMSLKTKGAVEGDVEEEAINKEEEKRVSWFLDDDPSPRPPKCTVLWKELLRLKKQRASSSLSPSSSSSSTSSSSSSLGDAARKEERKEEREKAAKRIKKGLERTRSASMRIRPIINVPICSTHPKSTTHLPPLFPSKKGRLDRHV